ncbi:hypothetical protein COV82_04405 [Candidatus Peregrinibacteria bacterium CG11_big_fil_rev_8_21_14_0_20_46_8]|nr:MAG: hypothetical protein COV82_04405 [Candidatus Peregrinibacteria bacterium CG11_big_fil_rev_8_21_14_0_20_46_8]
MPEWTSSLFVIIHLFSLFVMWRIIKKIRHIEKSHENIVGHANKKLVCTPELRVVKFFYGLSVI